MGWGYKFARFSFEGIAYLFGVEKCPQNVANFFVDNLHAYFTLLNSLNKRIGKIKFVEGSPCSHFQIKASIGSFNGRVSSTPIGHNHSFKSPLFAKNIGKKMVVFATPVAPEFVVRTHGCQYVATLNRCFKTGQVNFAQCTFRHVNINSSAVEFLIIQRKMLYTSSNIVCLNTLNIRYNHFRNQKRVFA